MKKIGYVEIKIDKTTSTYFGDVVKSICCDSELYKSDVIDYINGDVTNNLHFTLFYGCTPTVSNLKILKDYVTRIKLSKLVLGKLFLLNGYNDSYNVLCIEVTDVDGRLKQMSDKIASFGYDTLMVHNKFMPHLTLAYVKTNYTLPGNVLTKKIAEIELISLKFD